MGVFFAQVTIENPERDASLELEAMVDTGASYTFVPASLLDRLGIERTDRQSFEFADGRMSEYDLGEARATVEGRSTGTWIAFADENTQPLLGAYTLEGLRLAADPASLRLVPSTKAWAGQARSER